MKVKFYSIAKNLLDSVPVVGGQIVVTTDSNGFYYDMNGKRYSLQPADEILYELADSDNVTSSGLTGDFNYTVDTGTLGESIDLTATEFESLVFVFYDKGHNTMFEAVLHGLKYEEDLYTYNTCNTVMASLDTDSTQIVSDNNIYRDTIYARVSVTGDGTFRITSKTSITETVTNNVVTMTEKDISGDNRLALIKVIGRR